MVSFENESAFLGLREPVVRARMFPRAMRTPACPTPRMSFKTSKDWCAVGQIQTCERHEKTSSRGSMKRMHAKHVQARQKWRVRSLYSIIYSATKSAHLNANTRNHKTRTHSQLIPFPARPAPLCLPITHKSFQLHPLCRKSRGDRSPVLHSIQVQMLPIIVLRMPDVRETARDYV